jgi:integrase
VLHILPYTGMRIGEALLLRRMNIESRSDGYWLWVVGKRNKTREIPLVPEAVSVLDEYIRVHWPGSKDSDKLFPVGYASVYEKFVALREKIGVPWLSPHAMRHTFATQLRENDVDLDTIRELLGHSKIDTTLIYSHPTSKVLRGAVRRGFGTRTQTPTPSGPGATHGYPAEISR